MLIVNQEKDTIINMENVQAINVHLTRKKEICAWFSSNEDLKNSILLGTYETEERAKGVLHDLIRNCSLEGIKNQMIDDFTGAISVILARQHSVYYMPEK